MTRNKTMCEDTSQEGPILFNKLFIGDYVTRYYNTPHEIIDFLRSDQGDFYVYNSPHGDCPKALRNNKLESKYMVLTTDARNNDCQILGVIKLTRKLHSCPSWETNEDGLPQSPDAKAKSLKMYKNAIQPRTITYGGKTLDEIFGKDCLHVTFQGEAFYKAKRPIDISPVVYTRSTTNSQTLENDKPLFMHISKLIEQNINNGNLAKYPLETVPEGKDVKQFVDDEFYPRKREEFSNTMISDIIQNLEANGQIILHGAPGTGKTHLAQKIIAPTLTASNADNGDECIRFVQFHPGYDYSDFIVGLKPRLVGEKGKEQVSFEWRSGIFKEIAQAAKNALEKEANAAKPNEPFNPSKFVLIIDEINRADLSNVFGEVFSCIERGYRFRYKRNDKGCLERDGNGNLVEENTDGVLLPSTTMEKSNGADAEQSVREKLVIPENLYIIGTMNDIDRSVESMDFALRRRFAWREIKASDTQDAILAKFDKEARKQLAKAMDKLNGWIDKQDQLGESYKLGAAYFANLELYESADKTFDEDAYESLWKNHLEVILSEYLRGQTDAQGKTIVQLKNDYDSVVKQKPQP